MVCQDTASFSCKKREKRQSGGLENPKPLLLATCSLSHRGGIDTSQSQILCRSLEAQEKMDIVRVSVVHGFCCLPSSFPGGRNNHPQTVILRLLGWHHSQSRQAAFYNMHLFKNQIIWVGRGITLWVVTVFYFLKRLAWTELCVSRVYIRICPYIMRESFLLCRKCCPRG